MKQQIVLFCSIFALLLIIGAGCDKSNNYPRNGEKREYKDNIIYEKKESNNNMKETKKDDMEENVDELVFSGEALGEGKVLLKWKTPEDMNVKDGFYMFYDEGEDLEYPEARWWWWRGPAHREHIWEGIEPGTWTFRLCIKDGEECGEYSDEIELEVK